MKNRLGFISKTVLIAALAAGWLIQAAWGQDKTQKLPKFEKIEAAVWRYFQSQEDYQDGMIITQQQVEPLLGLLKGMGFNLPDKKSILEKIPSSSEFLVGELYSPPGWKFMERIAKYPDAYDRLDRLCRLPHGKQTVHDLIIGPGGEKMIQYMTAAPGGKEMGKMLANAPKGTDFNKPTGRIYTVAMLVKQLQEQYRTMVDGRQ
jgi:hypothetical protein